MTVEQAWDYIKNSPKTKFVKGQEFSLDLPSGQPNYNVQDDDVIRKVNLPIVVMEHFGEVPMIFAQHDYLYFIDKMDETLNVKKEVHKDRLPGLNVVFSTNTLRYWGIRREQLDEMYIEEWNKKQKIAECKAKKKEQE